VITFQDVRTPAPASPRSIDLNQVIQPHSQERNRKKKNCRICLIYSIVYRGLPQYEYTREKMIGSFIAILFPAALGTGTRSTFTHHFSKRKIRRKAAKLIQSISIITKLPSSSTSNRSVRSSRILRLPFRDTFDAKSNSIFPFDRFGMIEIQNATQPQLNPTEPNLDSRLTRFVIPTGSRTTRTRTSTSTTISRLSWSIFHIILCKQIILNPQQFC